MKLQNFYLGIDPIIVKNVKYYAKCLKRSSCFTHESLYDIEQELFCSIWPSINQYKKDKSSFSTFVS